MDVHQTYTGDALWDEMNALNFGIKRSTVKVTVAVLNALQTSVFLVMDYYLVLVFI